MKKVWLLLCTLSLFAMEPLLTTIEHPIRLAFYNLYPNDTKIEKKLSLTWSEANDYENEDIYLLDYELASLTFSLETPISQDESLRIILPVHHVYGGFLDGVLDWFHDATGLLNGTVHNIYGDNEVHYQIGNILSIHKPYTILGNIEIEYKKRLNFHPFSTNSALAFGIKIPASSKDRGFSSAKVDYSIIGILEKDNFLANISITKLGIVHLGNYAVSHKLLYSLYLGYHYKKWLFEYRFISSAFKSRYSTLDSPSNVVNIAYSINKHMRAFVTENLSPFYGSADFTIGLSYTY